MSKFRCIVYLYILLISASIVSGIVLNYWPPITWVITSIFYVIIIWLLHGFHDERLKPEPSKIYTSEESSDYLRVISSPYIMGKEPYVVFFEGHHVADVARGSCLDIPLRPNDSKFQLKRIPDGDIEAEGEIERSSMLYIYSDNELPPHLQYSWVLSAEDIDEDKNHAKYNALLREEQSNTISMILTSLAPLLLMTFFTLALTFDLI